jgi:LysM repeat protein
MSSRKGILFSFSFLALSIYSLAQAPKFKEIKGKADYPFILYLPDTCLIKEKPPIIVFLHGRSLSGTDLALVKKYGVIDAIERGRKVPAIVIAPQVKKTESWQADKVLNVLEYVQKNYDSDLSRVYIVGMSLGGYGTLNFIGKYPEKVAAAVALCGGGNLNDACNIGKTNIWIQHGELDKAVPVSESIKIYDAVSTCNPQGQCKLTLYPKFGHGELADEFYKDTLYNWIFQFHLNAANNYTVNGTDTIRKVLIVDTVIFIKPLPNETLKPKTEQKSCYHVIKKGDTLYALSKKYKTTTAKLCQLNGINENAKLRLGQKLRINNKCD